MSVAAAESTAGKLRCGQYLGEISALCLLHQSSSDIFLLAGTGSHILLYDLSTGKTIESYQVFNGVRVHGIVSSSSSGKHFASDCFLIAVFGETRVKLFTLQIQQQSTAKLVLIRSLPRFTHWVLDACFLKRHGSESSLLGVGCSDNSVYFWDVFRNCVLFQVTSAERCLLYSMRMFGDEIESLRIASGTIFNEIVVWKVVFCGQAEIEDKQLAAQTNTCFTGPEYKDALICRLVGHEGSIFRIGWFSDGSKLVSVSDDRSARIWKVQTEDDICTNSVQYDVSHLNGPVLFGHNARIWDCCISDCLIITAGEDCTCRIWDHNGRELNVIKEHIGRGVWRCLYVSGLSLLVTAGFDSSVKIHQISTSSLELGESISSEDFIGKYEVFALSLPNSSGHSGLMDSKSEYVRCLHFMCEDSLYVATNNGYLYHAMLLNNNSVKWTELTRISEEAPIICMDIFSKCSNLSNGFEDWIAVGDGKGRMSIIVVVGNGWSRKVDFTLTWSAEKERHLLGTYWCKSLENRFVFTADPSGRLKLWKLCLDMPLDSVTSRERNYAFLIAEYVSCFGMRIMCMDASSDEELLICGDIRGNLLLFSFPQGLLESTSIPEETRASPINHFKGAHGVSAVSSVSIAGLLSDQVEMCSTGADGCICYFHYDRDAVSWEFIGMKQVKELTVVRSVVSNDRYSDDCAVGNYAVGFASDNFLIWNLTSETKVTQITCGGWRRPHSFYIGDSPETMNCFSFVKNEIIHIHRHWKTEKGSQTYPRNLHLTFHGREIHSLCFISGHSMCSSDRDQETISSSSWIATGCEDGSVRLTRCESGMLNWSSSQHLGEHVGGSAVRSICSVSKVHMFVPDAASFRSNGVHGLESFDNVEEPFLLISVGAKRVVTTWKQVNRMENQRVNALNGGINDKKASCLLGSSSATVPSLSFKWLSSDMPLKHDDHLRRTTTKKGPDMTEDLLTSTSDSTAVASYSSRYREMESGLFLEDDNENDWRYLDVTAFLVKLFGSRISVCFVVISCSDATVTLRALVLPFRLWFDVALMASLSSPILALQHVVIPKLLHCEDIIRGQNLYFTIGGSTDGSIAIWDLTECIENFMQRVSGLELENCLEFQKRPRTGRGSQGGRRWRSIDIHKTTKKPGDVKFSIRKPECGGDMEAYECETPEISLSGKDDENVLLQRCNQDSAVPGQKGHNILPETTVLGAVHVINNVHQSGVNCIHVTDIIESRLSDAKLSFYVVTGGDDQSINCLRCDVEIVPENHSTTELVIANNCDRHFRIQNHAIQLSYLDKINSAHSSAVKGVWTNGIWFFSVGLDQRIRCWNLDRDRLTERAHFIVSVPEPEALDVKICDGDYYQIAVAGRGMQIVEFRP